MCERQYDYEVAWPITYGGAAGDYVLTAPWNGPAEMCIMAAFATGVGATAFISPSKTTAGVASQIATTTVAGTSGTPGIYLDGSGIGIIPLWFPVDSSCSMVITTGTFLVSIGWRRRRNMTATTQLQKVIPQEASTNG